MSPFVIISGCSGGGKSSLIAELGRRGFTTVEEPGRRIIRSELRGSGKALPWVDPVAFALRSMELALEDRNAAQISMGWVFFDRGLIDAAAALHSFTGDPALQSLGGTNRYNQRVFLTPPWPEIYVRDEERRHGIEDAVAEYDRLLCVYPALGYEVAILPKVSVTERADLVLTILSK